MADVWNRYSLRITIAAEAYGSVLVAETHRMIE
jgi:hypothetical protein